MMQPRIWGATAAMVGVALALGSYLALAVGGQTEQDGSNVENPTMSEEPRVRLGTLGHIMLGVSDMERSLTFYRDALGMTVLHASKEFAFLDAGGITLALSAELAKAEKNLSGAVELVFSVDDVHAAHSGLKNRGVEFQREPRVVTEKDWATNFRDPDGHLLSIFGAPGK